MRLLIDENLSPRLALALADSFPDSIHVRDVGLKGADDRANWSFAADHGYAIPSKDDDFMSLSLLRGAPPKLILLVIGNITTGDILQLLLRHSAAIRSFLHEEGTSLLTLHKC